MTEEMKSKYLIFGLILFLFVDSFIRYFAQNFIRLYDRFAYIDKSFPNFINSFANFDGVHYINIAKIGYTNNDFVFLPLYPSILHIFNYLAGNYLISGFLISILFLLADVFILKKYIPTIISKKQNYLWFFLLLITFPTSFFLNSLYSEVIFFFLVIGFFYFLAKENYPYAFLFAFLAPLTKLIGLFLIIPIGIFLISKYRAGKPRPYIFTLLFPLMGLSVYSLYLYLNGQHPLSFLTLHSTFGAERSTHMIFLPQVYYRYLKIFTRAAFNYQYFIAVVEFFFFNLTLMLLILDLRKILGKKERGQFFFNRLSLNLFSFTNILLPTLTGTFLSVPRFSLLSLSLFCYLAEIESKIVKMVTVSLFILLHIILLAFFTQGYFVS